MNKRVTSILLCAALICALLSGCGNINKPGGESGPAQQATEPVPTEPSDEQIPAADLPLIDWNTAFDTEGLPAGELDGDSVAFLKRNADGSETVISVPKAELSERLPKRLPRTRYYERFMDPAVTEELLPVIDLALFMDCFSMCVPTCTLSKSLVEDSGKFLSPTYFDTYDFSAHGVRRYDRPDGQTLVFLRISIDNYSQIRDKYRRLDGMNAANAFVDNLTEELDERGKMFFIYRWLTGTVQYFGEDGDPREYYERATWSLLFDAMIGHAAVDAGYAETLTIICSLAGIECFSVRSDSHIWNVARIDGKYYRFDAACDWGLTPAEFRYFGASDETFRKYHGEGAEPLPFYKEYCPACEEDLFPPLMEGVTDETSPAYKIAAYYRLLNARNAKPLLVFYMMGYEFEAIGKEYQKEGWVRTRVETEALMEHLKGYMTDGCAAQFAAGYLEARTEGDTMLSYRVPPDDPELIRPVSLERNADGTWTVELLRFRTSCEFTPESETVTMVLVNGEWFVDSVERNAP